MTQRWQWGDNCQHCQHCYDGMLCDEMQRHYFPPADLNSTLDSGVFVLLFLYCIPHGRVALCRPRSVDYLRCCTHTSSVIIWQVEYSSALNLGYFLVCYISIRCIICRHVTEVSGHFFLGQDKLNHVTACVRSSEVPSLLQTDCSLTLGFCLL